MLQRFPTVLKTISLGAAAGLAMLVGAQPSSADTGAAAESAMLVGATVFQHSPRDSVAEELEFLQGTVGNLEIRRVFDTGFSTNFMTRAGADVGRRATHYSFKPNMAALAAGTLDGEIRTLLASIPAKHRTMLTVWHEPEDNFTTAADQATYRAGWRRFANLVHDSGRPELTTSWVMMSYSWWVSSQRDPMVWYPGDAYVDSAGFDTYNEGSLNGTRWDSPGRGLGMPAEGDTAVPGGYVYGGAIRWAKSRDIAWGIAEFGSLENVNHIDSGWSDIDEKYKWIRQAVTFFNAQGASYIEYFHCGPYRGHWWLDSSTSALASYKWAIERY